MKYWLADLVGGLFDMLIIWYNVCKRKGELCGIVAPCFGLKVSRSPIIYIWPISFVFQSIWMAYFNHANTYSLCISGHIPKPVFLNTDSVQSNWFSFPGLNFRRGWGNMIDEITSQFVQKNALYILSWSQIELEAVFHYPSSCNLTILILLIDLGNKRPLTASNRGKKIIFFSFSSSCSKPPVPHWSSLQYFCTQISCS